MKQQTHLIPLLAFALACNSPSSPPVDPTNPVLADDGSDPREQALALLISKVLQTNHLRARPLDDAVSEKAFANYLEQLDPGKMFLLAEHVAELESHKLRMDDEMRTGRFALARAGEDLLRKRLANVAALVAERLQRPFDFTIDEELETDADKQSFCASEAALADRWRKNLKFEVLVRIARMEDRAKAISEAAAKPDAKPDAEADARPGDEIPTTHVDREAKARAELTKSYSGRFARLAKIEPFEGTTMFLNAITEVYDPHTLYLPPASKENFDIEMSGSLEGIGAILSESDHYIRVVQIVPGGASWRQGLLEAGDLILSVQQADGEPVDVGDMRIDNVVKMVRGPKDSDVTLTIEKPDGKIKVITITRDIVKIETAYARGAILEASAGKPMGYIYLPGFYGNTREQPGQTPERDCTDDVRRLLAVMARRKVSGVILDLRGNGGGLLDDARDMSGLFIETGPIVQTRTADGVTEVLRDKNPSVSFSGQVVVLVDRLSASASEILAAALQDYRRAIVVGAGSTHGKGTVQVLFDLDRFKVRQSSPPLGVLKLTYQQFFRVTGSSTQWRGVVADIALPDPYAFIESGERHLDNSIPWSETSAVEFKPWPPQSWTTAELTAASQRRQAPHEVFAKIGERNQLLRERRDQTVVALQLSKWLARRARDRRILDDVAPNLDSGPARFTVTGFDYDGKPLTKAGGESEGKLTAEQYQRWGDELTHDPWVEEALLILNDMVE